MIILEPTVEFEPSDWISQKGQNKIGTPEWNEHWGNFLKTIGITPTYPGSWHISVNEISRPEVIKKILALTFDNDLSLDDIDDSLMALSGGYMLFEDDRMLFEPQCCCDLGDLDYWKELNDLESENWHNLSMGHALMSARKIKNTIEIKEVFEYGYEAPIIEKVKPDELQAAISKAEQTVIQFKEKITPVVNELFNNRNLSIKIAEKLTGLS